MALIDDLERYVAAAKTFGGEPQWFYDNDDKDRYSLSVPLYIDFVIQEGLYFEAHCLKHVPDKDVTVLLLYKPPAGLHGPIVRFDWNPFHLHENHGRVSGPWRWRKIKQTHHHAFELNRGLGWERMARNNLPIALPVEEPLNGFRDMLKYVGSLWNIKDIQKLPLPKWEERLT